MVNNANIENKISDLAYDLADSSTSKGHGHYRVRSRAAFKKAANKKARKAAAAALAEY